MSHINFLLMREVIKDEFTLGRLYQDGVHIAYTCEDCDRELEDGGTKVPRETAIPRGLYRLTTSMSARFSMRMPLIENVPDFEGVRIHGGNTHRNTEGCPLIGAIRTDTGVTGCTVLVANLIRTITETEAKGGDCWIEVR